MKDATEIRRLAKKIFGNSDTDFLKEADLWQKNIRIQVVSA